MDNLLKQLAYEWEKEKSMLHNTINEYKKENDELNEKNDKYEGAYNGYGCKELYEENEELKEEVKQVERDIDEWKKENYKLQKENEELKEKLQSIYQEDGS